MKKKQSEEDLGIMMRGYGWFTHKWRDRGYVSCPGCHRAIVNCPYCHGSMLLPKAQRLLDFTVAVIHDHIECKEGDADWYLWDVSEDQTEVLNNALESTNGNGWIFLTIGSGKAPEGREAYLIHWMIFVNIREREENNGHKSVRFRSTPQSHNPEARKIFERFKLEWKGGRWSIPEEHIWWRTHRFSTCRWVEVEGPNDDTGTSTWESDCGLVFSLSGGLRLQDRSVYYCQKCGGAISEAPLEEDPDDE